MSICFEPSTNLTVFFRKPVFIFETCSEKFSMWAITLKIVATVDFELFQQQLPAKRTATKPPAY